MEKRVNIKIETYMTQFKDNIRNKINELGFEEQSKINELLEYTYDYNRLQIAKEEFLKRIRVKNVIPNDNRCTAKRCNGEQCSRRRKNESIFCGTHTKGTPHGLIELNTITSEKIHKIEVVAREINGIVYYLDNFSNVYKTEDILEEKQNPKIIAKYTFENDVYRIPELGIV